MKIPLFSFVAIFALSGLASAAPDLKATAAKIDELILAKLAKEKIQPNAQASDEVFVRRVYLDIIGRIPSIKETTDFLADQATDKRAKLIDELLASDGYTHSSLWAIASPRAPLTPLGCGRPSTKTCPTTRWCVRWSPPMARPMKMAR
jgi:hypothetical protein